jgi:hypothetical protein
MVQVQSFETNLSLPNKLHKASHLETQAQSVKALRTEQCQDKMQANNPCLLILRSRDHRLLQEERICLRNKSFLEENHRNLITDFS